MKESLKRTIVKTITYRMISGSIVFSLSYLFSENVRISLNISLSQIMLQTLIYFIYDRIWNKIKWEKKYE